MECRAGNFRLKRRWWHGKLAVFDISESGRQIGEKLLTFLDPVQREELKKYIHEYEDNQSGLNDAGFCIYAGYHMHDPGQPLTEIWEGELYFCLEQRLVRVCGQEIILTAKEFDILALLIHNPCRVFTFEMIMDLVWNEDCDFYSRKVVINHVSNLRKKLRISDSVPDYIKSVRGIGYKFDGSFYRKY